MKCWIRKSWIFTRNDSVKDKTLKNDFFFKLLGVIWQVYHTFGQIDAGESFKQQKGVKASQKLTPAKENQMAEEMGNRNCYCIYLACSGCKN